MASTCTIHSGLRTDIISYEHNDRHKFHFRRWLREVYLEKRSYRYTPASHKPIVENLKEFIRFKAVLHVKTLEESFGKVIEMGRGLKDVGEKSIDLASRKATMINNSYVNKVDVTRHSKYLGAGVKLPLEALVNKLL